MICSCGNQNAYAMRFARGLEFCDKCANVRPRGIPDVYFRGPYTDPNLAHPNRPWEKDGVFIESREHKKRIMDELNVREGGDKEHGSRNFDKHLASPEKTLTDVKY